MKTKKYKIDSSSIDNSFNVNQSVAAMNVTNANIKTGKKYIIGAWGFEILACLLGLTIAFSLAQKSGGGAEASANSWNAMVIGAGLIIVALAELAKVPFSIALCKIKNWFVKGLCIIALTVAVVATFLNVYRALDQFYATREYSIQSTKDEIQRIDNELELKKEKITTNGNNTSKLNAELKQTNDGFSTEKTLIENTFIEDVAFIRNTYRAELDSIQRDIKTTQTAITINDANEIEAQIGKRKRVQDEIRKKHATIRINLETKLDDLRGKETKLQEAIRSEIAVKSRKKEEALSQLKQDQKDKQPEIDPIKAAVLSIDKDTKNINNEIEALKSNKNKEKNRLASLVFDLETYRLAQWWYGKDDPIELNANQVGLITTAFCVAFALIPALTGVFLALFGTVLQLQRANQSKTKRRFLVKLAKRLLSRRREQKQTQRKPRLGYRFNALLIALRKRLLKPKIVTQIKEVDKIVIVTNEVPKIIEKEIIVEVPVVETIEKFIGVPVPKDHDYFLNSDNDSNALLKTIDGSQKIQTNGNDGEASNVRGS